MWINNENEPYYGFIIKILLSFLALSQINLGENVKSFGSLFLSIIQPSNNLSHSLILTKLPLDETAQKAVFLVALSKKELLQPTK